MEGAVRGNISKSPNHRARNASGQVGSSGGVSVLAVAKCPGQRKAFKGNFGESKRRAIARSSRKE